MTVQSVMFHSTITPWHKMFEEAAQFATTVGRENLITIAHSGDHGVGVVTVWFWSDRLLAEAERVRIC